MLDCLAPYYCFVSLHNSIMSASRPAKGRIVPKKVAQPPQPVASSSKPKSKAAPVTPRAIENGGRQAKTSVASKIQAMHDAPRTPLSTKGKAKGQSHYRQRYES